MAVVDKYTDATQEADGRASALTSLACQASAGLAIVAVDSTDDDGSVYRVARNVPVSLTLVQVLAIVATGITAATDYDFGVYKTSDRGGAVLDKDLFMDGQTMATAGILNCLSAVSVANGNKSIADLYLAVNGSNIGESEVDLAFTANTVGSATGGFRVTMIAGHE